MTEPQLTLLVGLFAWTTASLVASRRLRRH